MEHSLNQWMSDFEMASLKRHVFTFWFGQKRDLPGHKDALWSLAQQYHVAKAFTWSKIADLTNENADPPHHALLAYRNALTTFINSVGLIPVPDVRMSDFWGYKMAHQMVQWLWYKMRPTKRIDLHRFSPYPQVTIGRNFITANPGNIDAVIEEQKAVLTKLEHSRKVWRLEGWRNRLTEGDDFTWWTTITISEARRTRLLFCLYCRLHDRLTIQDTINRWHRKLDAQDSNNPLHNVRSLEPTTVSETVNRTCEDLGLMSPEAVRLAEHQRPCSCQNPWFQ